MCKKKSRLNCFGRDFCGACQGAAQTAPAAKSPADRGKGVNGACGNVVIQERSESGSVVGALIQVAQLLGLLHHGGHQHFEEKICPRCGLALKKRNGRFGGFWGCTGFPDCRYTENEPSIYISV